MEPNAASSPRALHAPAPRRIAAAARRRAQAALTPAAGALLLATWAGHLGRIDWRLDLLGHWRALFALAGLLLAFAAALGRRRAAAGVALSAALWNAALVGGGARGLSGRLDGPTPPLRVVTYNALGTNPRVADAAELLAAVAAESDVLVVLELRPPLLAALEARPELRVRAARARADNYGIALLTPAGAPAAGRWRVADARLAAFAPPRAGGDVAPAIDATLVAGARRVALRAVHVEPPLSRAGADRRDETLRRLAAWADGRAPADGAPLLVGDLNATPWSAAWAPLARSAALGPGTRGGAWPGTWPAHLPAALAIPIDHVLPGGCLVRVARRVGPARGSDHRAVRAVLRWSGAPACAAAAPAR